MKNERRNTTVKKLFKQIEEASQENQALLLSLEQLLGKSPEGRIEVTTSKGKPSIIFERV